MALHLYSYFKTVDELKNKQEKIDYLKKNRHISVDTILKLAYDKTIKFDLPAGEPPYKASQWDEYSNLHGELKRFQRIFIEGAMPTLNPIRKESLFIEMLEFVDKDDAKLLIGIINKKLPFKTINEKLINEALPELLEDEAL